MIIMEPYISPVSWLITSFSSRTHMDEVQSLGFWNGQKFEQAF